MATKVLCECGCGKPVSKATRAYKSRGIEKGQHYRFRSGHAWKHAIEARPTYHGMYGTPTHNSWLAMTGRCTNKNHHAWHNYGGRGITVCERWQDFRAFFNDMGERPPGRTLDRYPNNDGNYEPGNCRWATVLQQHANCRTNRLLSFNGKSQHLSAWARELGLHHSTIIARLARGWSIQKTLSPNAP